MTFESTTTYDDTSATFTSTDYTSTTYEDTSTTTDYYTTTTEVDDDNDDEDDDDDDEDEDDEDDDDDEYNEIQCEKNEIYCLEKGYCSKNCDDHDFIHCPRGEFYCEESGICAKDCDDAGNEIKCPQDSIFSLETFSCQKRPKRDLDRSLWRDEDFDSDLNEEGCPGKKRYCQSIDACADNCDFFEEDSFFVVCKEGMVRKQYIHSVKKRKFYSHLKDFS